MGNFQNYLATGRLGQDVGAYDFGSIMHYGGFFFADDSSEPTITRRDNGQPVVAQRVALSDGDRTGATWQALQTLPKTKVWMQSLYNGRCISSNGRVYSCSSSNRRHWDRTHVFDGAQGQALINRSTRRCLGVRSNSNNNYARVEVQACTGQPHQRWLTTTANQLRNVGSNRCLEPRSRSNGTYLRQVSCNRSRLQQHFLQIRR